MQKQSRQQLRFQALLAERAHCMRHNMTETESQLWRQLAGSALGVAFKRQGYRVLRLPAELVRRNIEEVVSLIKTALSVAI